MGLASSCGSCNILPQISRVTFLSRRTSNPRDDQLHDRPLGGNIDCLMEPSLEALMYLMLFREVHSPFHSRKISRLPSSCISGSQKPESYSFSSAAIECLSKSSLVLEGRPGLRWLFNCASSSPCRSRYLDMKF